MAEALVAALVLIALQYVLEEVRARRTSQEKAELLRMIRSLENKLTAKDIAGYIALEEQDNSRIPPSPSDQNPEREFVRPTSDGRYFGGNVVYDDEP